MQLRHLLGECARSSHMIRNTSICLNDHFQHLASERCVEKDDHVSAACVTARAAPHSDFVNRLQELVTMLSGKKLFSSVFCGELMKLCKEGAFGKV